ncbi:protein DpdE [Gloeothece verrucosa]|uniref:Helicase domain protein n=1 Tax=Gloeothece verrucosa (strain PCC 7822) TaxID=497965 RepID=E0UAJ1_GLOV7|nr:protein DpdE [Gloeothece verrucosa]ADN12732.1 helicase domain protein [Gloeothece verrucosa PCC 7822]
MNLGFLVCSSENDFGIGKLIAAEQPNATVEYFYSVGQRMTQTVPLASIRRVRLQRQTRCYLNLYGTDTWQIGRIYAWDEENQQYQIDLPDSKHTFATESEIYVRCDLPIDDPMDILAMKGQETPYFHNQRSRFLQSLIKQRAVSRGMTGLLSANIELYPHQVEVVRRVLEDPIGRYLLADEVGLGKTIEAGVILRQFLLDTLTASALIVVPSYLVYQWRQELEDKFYLSQFRERVTILASEDWKQVQNSTDAYEFLIIDEAHHIAAMARSDDPSQRRCFDTCRKLAHHCPRLLLLSATPVLNHEQDFLAMLHLLDPTTYSLDDLEGFRERVHKRQNIGRVLLTFNEGCDPFVLKKSLSTLESLFSEDTYLLTLTNQLQTELENPDSEVIDQQIRAIRTYISDTYRLHRRMLRNRRATVSDVIFDRNAVPKLEYDLDERAYSLHELLEEWRTAAPDEANYQRIFLLLFRASNTWLGILQQLLESRLRGVGSSALRLEWGQNNSTLLTKTPLFEGESAILKSIVNLLKSPSEDGDRLELLKIVILYHLADHLNLQKLKGNLTKLQNEIQQRILRPFAADKFPKLMIFTSFTGSCTAIIDFISAIFGANTVVSHRTGDNRDTIETNLNRFKTDPQCFLLVADASGEEGRNLQFIDGVIHFDLPFSPNQLEQRLGRVDRIGGKINLNSWLLAGVDLPDSPSAAWYQLLSEGLGIFNHSISSLQFYVEASLPELEKTLFKSGASGWQEIIGQIQSEVENEKVKISEQTVLDEIDLRSEVARDYFEDLDSYDQNHKNLEKATEGWLCSALRFQRLYDENLAEVRHYKATQQTLIPLKDLKNYFAAYTKNKGVYNRRVANKYSGVHLYRIGEELIDTLTNYLNLDERGKAFAMWRQEPTWDSKRGGEWLGFRFDYLIELDWTEIQSIIQSFSPKQFHEKALKRQRDGLFPPLMETVFLDVNLQRVEDEALLKILSRPYVRKNDDFRDYNLAKERLEIFDEFIDPSEWQNLCYQAGKTAEKSLKESPHFREYCQKQTEIAKRKLDTRLHQLQCRYNRFSHDSLAKELEFETALSATLLKAISSPRLYLDAVGFIIVSERAPVLTAGGDIF